MSRALATLIFRWRFPLSAFILLGALVLAPRANITRIDNDITAWFSKDDPVYRDYERFREEFAGTRTLIVALKADSASRLFSAETLDFIERVTGDIERVDTVQRVDSLATATIVDAVPDGLDVRPLLDYAEIDGADAARRRALEDDLIRGDLVSEDGTVTAIVVSFDEDRIDAVRAGVIQQIHGLVDPGLPAGVRAYYNGSLEISETYNRITLDNQRKFTPPMFLLVTLAIYAMFRSVRKTALALIAIVTSIFWTLGLYSLLGFSYNVLTSMIVPLIVVLAIADDVHIMQHWDEERRLHPPEEAFKRTVAHLATPLFGASVTTALGMLSLATSSVVAVKSFGIGAAVGIMIDFAVSLVLMPTMLSLVRAETHETPNERLLFGPLRRVAMFSTRHPGAVLIVTVGIGVAAALGIVRLRVDTNHINFFSADHPLGASAAVIDGQLSGVYSFQIMLEGPPESLRTPDALQRIDRLQEQLRGFAHVRKVTSVADYVKRINKELNDGREEANVIPDDANTIAQELFVFALGGEGRHELERIVASDYSRAQINVKLQSMSSDLVLVQVEEADRLAKAAFEGTGIGVLTTGSGRLFSTLDHYLVSSQLTSFATAFVTVFGVIFVVFRSFRFGALTIVPNLLPVLAVLGVMGYLDISMNVATVMVASVALGVVDDDTIHFINRYRREIAGGASTDEAIEIATTHEGRASLTTAMINGLGFGVLMTSEYKPTAWFGGLLALTMAAAFLAEVFILPAAIKLMPRVFGDAALRRRRVRAAAAVVAFALITPAVASAQNLPSGHVSAFTDYVPNRDDTVELRGRLYAEETFEPAPALRLSLAGFAEGLLAARPVPEAGIPTAARRATVRDAILRVQDASVEVRAGAFDLLAGYTRVVWGRLDELQPTDVVNPLDVSRFFFEGRSEARLPVALVRGRAFAGDLVVEGLYVADFRRARFDQLDEPSSPFNVVTSLGAGDCLPIGCPPEPPVILDREPGLRASNGQGGARLSATTGRVDWSVAAYRGFESFGLFELLPSPPAVGFPITVARIYPRFTMIGGDFETVRGQWGVRGEAAVFADDNFQSDGVTVVKGSSFDVGIGVDRRAGDYRVSAAALFHREDYDGPLTSDGPLGRDDLSLILSADRSFLRERYRARLFAVVNPSESSSFLRGIASAELRDNVAFETSAGWFAGEGADLVGRFSDTDFVYVRLKYYF
jgi:predicted RND superfamily exporter protein